MGSTVVEEVYDNSLPIPSHQAADGAEQSRYLTPSVVVRSLDPDVELYNTEETIVEETDVDVLMYDFGPNSAHEYEYSEFELADTADSDGLYDTSNWPKSEVSMTSASKHNYDEVVGPQPGSTGKHAAADFVGKPSVDFNGENYM